ncbi:MAG: YitT family protein [Actinomycetes bacterium]
MTGLSFLRPSRTVPVTWWRSESRWRARPSSFAILAIGQWLFGTGEAFLVASSLGVSPWTVLAQGLSVRLAIPIGLATFVVSALVLLLWIPLRERPGLGTIANAVIIATALQVIVQVLPEPQNVVVRLLFVFIGITLIGIGSGLYLTANLGPGPRDGWMTGLHVKFGWPISTVRLAIEAVVLVLGWLLGGTVGIGTVLFALLIGPAVGYGLRFAGRVGRTQTPELTVDDDEFPEGEA